MLKPRHLILSLALLIAFVGDSSGQSSLKQSPANQTPKAEQTPAPDQRGTPDHPLTVNVVPTAEQKALADQQAIEARNGLTQNGKLVDYAWDQVLVGIVTFCIFVLQLIAFVAQAFYMRRSVVEMRRTTHAAIRSARAAQKSANHIPRVERAYLFLGLEVSSEVTEFKGLIDGPKSRINFGFKNHGKTPAIVEELCVNAGFWGASFPAMETAIRLPIQKGWVISAGEVHDGYSTEFPVYDHEIERAQKNKGYILFWGKIVYLDVFKERHESGWCRAYDFKSKGWLFAADETLNYYT